MYSTVFLHEETEAEATLTARASFAFILSVAIASVAESCTWQRPRKSRLNDPFSPLCLDRITSRVKLVLRQLHLRQGICVVHLTVSRHVSSRKRYKKCRAPSMNVKRLCCVIERRRNVRGSRWDQRQERRFYYFGNKVIEFLTKGLF